MEKVIMTVLVLLGLSGGVYAGNAMEQLQVSIGKEAVVPSPVVPQDMVADISAARASNASVQPNLAEERAKYNCFVSVVQDLAKLMTNSSVSFLRTDSDIEAWALKIVFKYLRVGQIETSDNVFYGVYQDKISLIGSSGLYEIEVPVFVDLGVPSGTFWAFKTSLAGKYRKNGPPVTCSSSMLKF